MKAWFVAAVAAVLTTSGAQAATVWQGEAVIDSASAACSNIISAPLKADAVLKTVLKPKNLSGNDANTHVSFIANDIAMFAITLNMGQMPNGNAAGFGNTTSGLIKANVTIAYNNFVQNPATIVLATDRVTLRGTIQDFMFVSGCAVQFRAAYSKRGS